MQSTQLYMEVSDNYQHICKPDEQSQLDALDRMRHQWSLGHFVSWPIGFVEDGAHTRYITTL